MFLMEQGKMSVSVTYRVLNMFVSVTQETRYNVCMTCGTRKLSVDVTHGPGKLFVSVTYGAICLSV